MTSAVDGRYLDSAIGTAGARLEWKLGSGMIFTNVLVLFVFLQGAAPTSSTDESPRLDPEIERRMLLDARTGAARPPLLPEGAFLTAVRGRVGFDDSVGAWTLSTGRDEGDVRVFGLLPSRSLGDMLRIIDVAGERTDFEVTGRVLVYDGMNFLLPSFGARLTDPTVPGIPADGALEAVSTDPDATPNSLAIEDAGVADRLEARLRNRIESLPTSSDTGDVHVKSIGTLGEGTRIQNRRCCQPCGRLPLKSSGHVQGIGRAMRARSRLLRSALQMQ